MQSKISQKIEKWYRASQRELPFRKTKDPYAIWVSEIMAQQTRIDTMLPYYENWMKRWPTIQSLANADLQEVLHIWQGLGYYNRARKLVEGAQMIQEKFNGVFPKNVEEIRMIAGIGDYTAGAIASIAFGLEEPAVDGNVFRVVSRLFMMEDDITKIATRKKVTAICKKWMEGSNPSDLTQGIMELGAMVCTFKNPKCDGCPIQKDCQSLKHGKQLDYPVKKKSKAPIELALNVYILIYKDKICISKDDQDGLMKDFLRLPQFNETIQVNGEVLQSGQSKHVFSHRIWMMNWTLIECEKQIELVHCEWKKKEEVNLKSIVTAHRKILKKLNILSEHPM